MEDAGLVNLYTCRRCGGSITTWNRDAGTTPFTLRCQVDERCGGTMQSACYVLPADIDLATPPGWMWYRPKSAGERKKLGADRGLRNHVADGGLLLKRRHVVH